MQHNLALNMLKEAGHLHILYAGQWKFGRASRIYITLDRWASSLEMLISTPAFVSGTELRTDKGTDGGTDGQTDRRMIQLLDAPDRPFRPGHKKMVKLQGQGHWTLDNKSNANVAKYAWGVNLRGKWHYNWQYKRGLAI